MKEIISKHVPEKWLKRRKKDLAKVKLYWSNLEPDDYAKDMTADYSYRAASFAIGLKKFASDAKDVVFTGKLKQTSDGFVFVDIPNSIFDGFIPLLSEAERPPKDEKHEDIGAHITVIKKKEISENDIDFQDSGKNIEYKVRGLEEVEDPDGWDEMKKVWFLKVDAPELEDIRKSYGLPARIKNHDFHITIGVQKRGEDA